MDNFNEAVFRQKVDQALATVKTVLDTTKHPKRPQDCTHVYEDKYQLVERGSRAAVSAVLVVLDSLGAGPDAVDQMMSWNLAKKTVTLRLSSTEKCTFVKKTVREEESKTKYVTESESTLFGKSKREHKTVTKIEEWIWKWDYDYQLTVYAGNAPDSGVVLQGRAGTTNIITTSDRSPHAATRVVDPIDVNISWLIDRVVAPKSKEETSPVDDLLVTFAIDREAKSCHTPRRNSEVDTALGFFRNLHSWAGRVDSYFRSVFSKQSLDKIDMAAINDNTIFVPVLPLMYDNKSGEGDAKALLPAGDERAFIKEQRRSLESKLVAVGKAFPDNSQLVTAAEANILCNLLHAKAIAERFSHVVDYVEYMIESQLIAAVGKTLTAKDFGEYMEFHCRKLFAEAYAPRPFVHAVRRPDHCPEGILSIEADVGDGSLEQPVQTISCTREGADAQPMYFALGAATKAAFVGAQTVHALLLHQFAGDSAARLRLVARARQFSSFVLLLGKVVAADTFKPSHGIIVQNKDELLLSLLLEQIPSAQQFRDAIESLSPEQQRFAKAFRAMQLESSLFAVCVVQIKPQMERLLNLPYGALTKEIQLTQDLMELFITYQVPSDLLSFDGNAALAVENKLGAVKTHVKALQDMIQASKDKELKEVKEEATFAVMDSIAESAPMAMPRMAARAMPMQRSMAPSSAPQPMAMAMSAMAPPPPSAAPVSVSSPAPPKPAPAKQQEPDASSKEISLEGDAAGDDSIRVDYTKLPAAIDSALDVLAKGQTVRPTTIKPATTWIKKFQKRLLAKPTQTTLAKDELHDEKNRAFDLLDALSKSGALPLGNTDLHIVMASTHCFAKTLMHTVTRDNINPIEKAEATAIIMAATIHGCVPTNVIRAKETERVTTFSPLLLTAGDDNDADK